MKTMLIYTEIVNVSTPASVGEENETLLIRVWKPLLSRRVLKTLRASSKGKAQREQYLLAVNLDIMLVFLVLHDIVLIACTI